jgi:hypothetical protein
MEEESSDFSFAITHYPHGHPPPSAKAIRSLFAQDGRDQEGRSGQARLSSVYAVPKLGPDSGPVGIETRPPGMVGSV